MRLSAGNLAWLVAYIVVVAAIVVVMFQVRDRTIAAMDNPQARGEWLKWKNDAGKTPTHRNPVERRPPVTDEPPALILMRDYFPTMMVGAIVFGSLLFGMLMMAVRGVLARRPVSIGRPADDLRPDG